MDSSELPPVSVSEFVALFNQTLELTIPSIRITGELANFRISKNRWVYFDLKDDHASVRFFGTVYNLPGPLEDGMLMEVSGSPRLHPLYNFSVNVINMKPVGEGSLKKAASLLEAKLQAEGLFDASRKRPLPYPPQQIGLITSGESAAFADFVKILNERWVGVEVDHRDVQVQGEAAISQIIRAIEYFNQLPAPPEVLVITRGGGSADDLAAFSHEKVTRAVAASRIPTLVAIGHEVDISLAEMAADQRASTPSNAAELLVPDKRQVIQQLVAARSQLNGKVMQHAAVHRNELKQSRKQLAISLDRSLIMFRQSIQARQVLLQALSPRNALKRGYAIIRKDGAAVRSVSSLQINDVLSVELIDGCVNAVMTKK